MTRNPYVVIRHAVDYIYKYGDRNPNRTMCEYEWHAVRTLQAAAQRVFSQAQLAELTKRAYK
jgi:hypothetical protein